jgi:hypothetical protein
VFAQWARDQQEPAPVVALPRPDMPDAAPGDAEPETAPTPVLTAQDPLAAYDQDMEDHMGTLGPEDDLRRRWLKQGERLKEILRDPEQADGARPAPDVTPEQNAAYVAAGGTRKPRALSSPATCARSSSLSSQGRGSAPGRP